MGVLEVPRVNANEDQVQVIDVRVVEGQWVEAGEVVLVVETTKAAAEIDAPAAGMVRGLTCKVGDFLQVGAPLCEIVSDGAATTVAAAASTGSVGAEVSVTAKARKLAAELGVDLGSVAARGGRVGEAEVRAAAARRPGSAPAATPAPDRPLGGKAVIVGGGGHAACLIDALQGSAYEIVGCTDTLQPAGAEVCAGVGVLGGENLLDALLDQGVKIAFVGIGGATSSEDRRAKFELLRAKGFAIPPVIHPSAVIGAGASIGDGCHVLAGATVGPRCVIGANVIVNQGAIVCHDSVVGDHVHLTPGSVLAGAVTVGAGSVVGMAATVLMRVRIGAGCLIHNGAHVSADVPDGTVVDAHGRRQRA